MANRVSASASVAKKIIQLIISNNNSNFSVNESNKHCIVVKYAKIILSSSTNNADI